MDHTKRCIVFGLSVMCFLLTTSVAQECGKPHIAPTAATRPDGRIMGGQEAINGSWPWMAHLQYAADDYCFNCGATILSSKWIITAAHCFVEYKSTKLPDGTLVKIPFLDTIASHYKARVGQHRNSRCSSGDIVDSTAKDYPIRRIIIHEKYSLNVNNSAADIALLEVDEFINFTNVISPICLPADKSDPSSGKSCVAVGWGDVMTKPDPKGPAVLMEVGLNIVDRETCNQNWTGTVEDDMICAWAEGKDVCGGDSGGPFACSDDSGTFVLEGIVSWGSDCGTYNLPGVYTRVGYYIPWIENITGIKGMKSESPLTFHPGIAGRILFFFVLHQFCM
ncbi:putative Acrosin [Hypsibius exemplaris]|uniref:limulus clotting factor C n=1 Tax=Hypsibius exemplaris TaxID=2072580 RepID=A0A9X6ND42_HYPEX|nr:putative Acrosin [Hypsibius exemplaris]